VNGKKRVEMVPGCWPFVGHGIAFSRDTLGFITNCAKKYGKVFRIKVFRTSYIVVCDRNLSAEFFRSGEETLSLNEVLSRFFFDDGFADTPNPVTLTTAIVRKSIAVRFDEFVPKIRSEAERMIERLVTKCEESPLQVDLPKEMFKFIANTSARCFLAFELTDEIFLTLRKFSNLINNIIIATYFLPKGLIRAVTYPWICPLRRKLQAYFEPEIQKYREDPEKRDSLIIRTAVDHVDEISGEGLTNESVSALLLTLLYVSSENSSLGLTNTLTDLACHPDYWEMLKNECREHLDVGDTRGILNSPLMNACVMESARTTPHIFPLNRKPQHTGVTLGDYYVGDADAVAMCSPLLMFNGYASEIFQEPTKYNPSRFLKKTDGGYQEGGGESFNQYNVVTWGAGLHLCPGKMFALYEIKMAVALILQSFRFEVNKDAIKGLNYFSPAAFAEREVETVIKLL